MKLRPKLVQDIRYAMRNLIDDLFASACDCMCENGYHDKECAGRKRTARGERVLKRIDRAIKKARA